jgi:hypothetical protein
MLDHLIRRLFLNYLLPAQYFLNYFHQLWDLKALRIYFLINLPLVGS